jgi:hypothetical protein
LLEKLKARIAEDFSFREIHMAQHREAVARNRAKINADPIKRAEMLQKNRECMARWRQELIADPDRYAQHLKAARAWYHSLSTEDRERIFYQPRRERAAKRETNKK